jgi:3-oxoacyl-[acyl-carrier-protein] synthase-3
MMTTRGAVIAGLGGFVPPRVVTNEELSQRIDTNDEWIRTRTGIEQRHFVDDLITSDLAAEAGRRALKNAGLGSVDFVVNATSTPDRFYPATGPAVATKIGLDNVPAMDIVAGCTGFIYGLHMAASMVMAGVVDTALLIGAEVCSLGMDNDRVGIIFGDGAGSVVLRAGEPDEPGAVLALDSGSDGALTDIITMRAFAAEARSKERNEGWVATADDGYLRMQGKLVFPHAVRRMVESSQTVLKKTGWTAEEVDTFVPHQANKRIAEMVAQYLTIPEDRMVSNIHEVANTSAASLPLALIYALHTGALRSEDKVLLTAFGGGATWGSASFIWPELDLPEKYNTPI